MSTRARDYQPGERLPGTVYEVVRLIGAGGMGTVYDVVDTTIGKRYVLKALHPQLGAREDLARRMQNEARTLARLNHSNIVDVITAGVTNDELRLPYYVMERLNGQSLRVVLEKKGQLELPHACHIGIDLLDALEHAHDKGVIHRDVKPDNIFLHRTPAGTTVTKLLDFGIVSLLDGTSGETAGRFLGTLRYAAPEQLRGEAPTAKMDIYAAALVLYEMIAGCGPFDDEADAKAIGAAHLERPPPPLSRFVIVPTELDALVMSALSKSPATRPRDAFSFAESLRLLRHGLAGARDSTADRVTTAAVNPSELPRPQLVGIQRASPDGPYVISPLREVVSPAELSLPRTTLPGTTPQTFGPSLPPHTLPGSTATTPDGVDREAPTSTFIADTAGVPQQGTEPLPNADGLGSRMPASRDPARPGDEPIRWPVEFPFPTSEAPQVRTVSSHGLMPFRWAAPVVVAGVAITILALKPLTPQRPRNAGAAAQSPTLDVGRSAAPATASTNPAPAVGPPGASHDDGDVSIDSTKGPPVQPAGAASRPKPAHAGSQTKPALSLRPDRPGPGF